ISLTIGDGSHTVSGSTTADGSGSWTISGKDVSSLSDGSNNVTYTVTATDGLGNTAFDSKTASKDTVAPSVTVDTAANINNANKNNGGAATGTNEAGATVSVKISDAGNAHFVGPFAATVSGTSWSISGKDVSSLNDGTITYTATATDAA